MAESASRLTGDGHSLEGICDISSTKRRSGELAGTSEGTMESGMRLRMC